MLNSFDWGNLRYFMALAKTLNLKEASKITGGTHATVSRRVKQLESDLKAKLFDVTPHGHSLTSTGDELLERCLPIEEQILGISRHMFGKDHSISGTIRVTTTDTLSHTVLPSIIKSYQKEFPNIELEILASSNFFNLSKREADIAIRPSSNPPENLIGRKLGRIKFNLYASSRYLKDNPINNLHKDKSKHFFIQLDHSLSHLSSKKWLDVFLNNQKPHLITDGLLTSAAMCSDGIGVAALPSYFTKYYKGLNLVEELDDKIGSDFWLLTHKDIRNTYKIRYTMDFLEKKLSKSLIDYI
jgi:DNA-binding transcriptional LysR family regulator